MKIHLKRNEKLFLNGAVIRLDRRGSIELLNDAQFLMENHILQQENAKTPLQQLYFIAQTMLMDPANAHFTMYLFDSYVEKLGTLKLSAEYLNLIQHVRGLVASCNYYGALKSLRQAFHLDQFTSNTKSEAA
jgi:flagellar biosynthesis repressor protein FlbT